MNEFNEKIAQINQVQISILQQVQSLETQLKILDANLPETSIVASRITMRLSNLEAKLTKVKKMLKATR